MEFTMQVGIGTVFFVRITATLLKPVQDDGRCAGATSQSDCMAGDKVNIGGVGMTCQWDDSSHTCLLPEPEEDLETSLIVSTVALIISLPFELLILLVFGAFIVRPTKRR